jgi:hypothetical protein
MEELKSDQALWRAFLAQIREERSPEGFVAALNACADNKSTESQFQRSSPSKSRVCLAKAAKIEKSREMLAMLLRLRVLTLGSRLALDAVSSQRAAHRRPIAPRQQRRDRLSLR